MTKEEGTISYLKSIIEDFSEENISLDNRVKYLEEATDLEEILIQDLREQIGDLETIIQYLNREITLLDNKVDSLEIDKRYYKGRYEQLKKEAK